MDNIHILYCMITDSALSEASSFRNGSFSVHWSWGGHLQSQAVARHPLLELSLPVEAEMLPMWSEQILTLGDGLSNQMHWTYSLVGDVRASLVVLLLVTFCMMMVTL